MIRAFEAFGIDLIDVLGTGRACGEPAVIGNDLEAADGGAVAGGVGEFGGDGIAGEGIGADLVRREVQQGLLLGCVRGGVEALVYRCAEFGFEGLVVFAGVLAGDRGDLRGEQIQEDAVLIGGPYGPVGAQEGGARAFFAAEAEGTGEQAVHEPFEAYGNFGEAPAQPCGHPVDHRAGHQGFAHGGIGAPAGAVLEQVIDGDGEVMIGVQEAGAARHDPVPVVVGVIAERDIETVLEADEAGHGVGRGAVHADLAVVVQGHEREGGIHHRIHHLQVQAVLLGNRTPITDARASHRVDPDLESGAANGLHVQDIRQIAYIGADIIVFLDAVFGERGAHRQAAHPGQLVGQQGIRPVLDVPGGRRVRGTAARGVVLVAAVAGRIVRRRDHHPVAGDVRIASVPGQYRMRDRGRRSVAAIRLDPDRNPIAGKYLHRRQ